MNALENWAELISYSVLAIEKNCNKMEVKRHRKIPLSE